MNHPHPITLPRRSLLAGALASLVPAAVWTPAHAAIEGQILYGFTAGGVATDVGELLAARLSVNGPIRYQFKHLPGAGGKQAHELVKKGATDGRTLLMASSSSLTLLPQIYRKLGYTVDDFAPVVPVYEFARSFTVGPRVPTKVKTIDDYARWVREEPSEANYGVPAIGSAGHYVGLMVANSRQLTLRPVAYRGSAALIKDLVEGALPAGMTIVGQNTNEFSTGRLRSLGVSSAQRWFSEPNTPTLAEQKVENCNIVEWHGLLGPGNITDAARDQINTAVRAILAENGTRNRTYLKFLDMSPTQFGVYIADDVIRWSNLIRQTRFTAME